MSGVPLLVDASELDVLIVGAGAVAGRRARAFADAGARVRVVAPEVSDVVRQLADAGRVALAQRRYEPGDVGSAVLVVAATDHRDTNARVASDARAAHRLVNVADAAGEGSFAVMASHYDGALTIGVSAGVPAAATRIRDAIAERFDARYGRALERLAAVRDRMLASGQSARWRATSAALLDAGFCASVDAGTLESRLAERHAP